MRGGLQVSPVQYPRHSCPSLRQHLQYSLHIFFGYYALHRRWNESMNRMNRIRCLQQLQMTRTTTCTSCQAAQRTFVTPIVVAAASGRRRCLLLRSTCFCEADNEIDRSVVLARGLRSSVDGQTCYSSTCTYIRVNPGDALDCSLYVDLDLRIAEEEPS